MTISTAGTRAYISETPEPVVWTGAGAVGAWGRSLDSASGRPGYVMMIAAPNVGSLEEELSEWRTAGLSALGDIDSYIDELEQLPE